MGQYTIGAYIREQKDKDSLEACFGTNWDKLSLAEIKKTYRKLSIDWHPDKNPAGEAMFKQLSKWYTALTDSEERKKLEADILAFNRANVYRTFAHNPADQHDNTGREGSSANSGHNWPPKPEPLQEQAMILNNLTLLMRQCNDYILNPDKQLSVAMIGIFEETLQACLRLQNYQNFIFQNLRPIERINKFLEESFSDEVNMRGIHNLMRQIIPRQEKERHSNPPRQEERRPAPERNGDSRTTTNNRRPEETAFKNDDDITQFIGHITEALQLYKTMFNLELLYRKQQKMGKILNYFNILLKLCITGNNSIKQLDYTNINLIYGIVQDLNRRDNLWLNLQETDKLMQIFNANLTPHSPPRTRRQAR